MLFVNTFNFHCSRNIFRMKAAGPDGAEVGCFSKQIKAIQACSVHFIYLKMFIELPKHLTTLPFVLYYLAG